MDAREAELIYEAGKEAVIKTLLEMGTKVVQTSPVVASQVDSLNGTT
jgi:hypothetical protein